jgi:hypothetical protein
MNGQNSATRDRLTVTSPARNATQDAHPRGCVGDFGLVGDPGAGGPIRKLVLPMVIVLIVPMGICRAVRGVDIKLPFFAQTGI